MVAMSSSYQMMFRRFRKYIRRAVRVLMEGRGSRHQETEPEKAPDGVPAQQDESESTCGASGLVQLAAMKPSPKGGTLTQQLHRSPKDGKKLFFFSDDPILFRLILQWDPRTMPHPSLMLRFVRLTRDHAMGMKQTRLENFYRIFLVRQMDFRQLSRPRFLTAERRACINRRRQRPQTVTTRL